MMQSDLESIQLTTLEWRKVIAEGLDLDLARLLPRPLADRLLQLLEEQVEYFSGDLARVHVYGKWHPIPRQQVSFGDPGRSYRFSGTSVPARPWPEVLQSVRDLLQRVTGHYFNFVLVNRYRDGNDYIAEHRDDEADLDPVSPIASLSLGQSRDFVLRHAHARRSGPERRDIDKVSLRLEHGHLLLMNQPTNKFWYHSLPRRKGCTGVRINLTFRKLK